MPVCPSGRYDIRVVMGLRLQAAVSAEARLSRARVRKTLFDYIIYIIGRRILTQPRPV